MTSEGKPGRNDPCPCGSGKKYKQCCQPKERVIVGPMKTKGQFTMPNGSKITRQITSMDSIPAHNKNGLTPDISPEQMMDLCLDEIFLILKGEDAGMLPDLVDKVVIEMDVVPTFTYKEISDRMTEDGRFEVVHGQICGLKGTNPVELIADALNF